MGRELKLVSGLEAVKKLQRAGWTVMRQRGSHVMLTKPGYTSGRYPFHSMMNSVRGCYESFSNKLKYR